MTLAIAEFDLTMTKKIPYAVAMKDSKELKEAVDKTIQKLKGDSGELDKLIDRCF